MFTLKSSTSDINAFTSDEIGHYIKEGYHIDAKESMIDKDSDKDCTFKAVLKRDENGIECKVVIKVNDNGDDKNKSFTYHKVETVGDTKWSEERRSFSSYTHSHKEGNPTRFEHIDDIIKLNNGRTKKVRRWKCTTPSAYKHNTCKCKCKEDKNRTDIHMSEIDHIVNNIKRDLNQHTLCSGTYSIKQDSIESEDLLARLVRLIFGL